MVESTRRVFMAGIGGAMGYGFGRRAMAFASVRQTALDAANIIQVRAKPKAIQGVLEFKGHSYDCMIGKSGIVSPKFEGDGGTPAGRFHMREVRYRPDRITTPPQTGLPLFKAHVADGWCDDPEDVAYNRIVRLPYQSDAETMWRDDHLYDVLGVIGYNDAPVVSGSGSAIFLHVMRPPTDDHRYTTGCVSMKLEDVLAVLAACTPSTMIDIRIA